MHNVEKIVCLGLLVGFAGCEKGGETVAPDTASVAPAPPAEDSVVDEFEAEDEAEAAAAADAEPAAPMLTTSLFEDTVQRHMDDVLDCYSKARGKKPKLAGHLLADFTIDGEGKITAVTAAEGSTLTNAGLLKCIADKAQGWELPPPPRSEGTNMPFPFDLEPA